MATQPFSISRLGLSLTINDLTTISDSLAAPTGFSGFQIVSLQVSIFGLTHTNPDDLDFLLVSPSGDTFEFWSDAGGSTDISGANFTIADLGLSPISDGTALTPGATYRPADYDASESSTDFGLAPGIVEHPGPNGTATFASVFNGTSLNGTWTLYIRDDNGGDQGSLIGGWSISGTVTNPDAPTDIITGGLWIREGSPNGTNVGTLTGIDPNTPASQLTHSLTNDAGGLFGITADGRMFLKDGSTIDFEKKTGYIITDKITDPQGFSFEKKFVVAIEDLADFVQADGRADRPDGSWLRTDFDNEDAFYWYLVADEHDANNQRIQQRVVEDNGIRRDISFDVYDRFVWDQVVDDWNAAGERDRQRVMYDDGSYDIINFDVAGLDQYDWAMQVHNHNTAGQLAKTTTTYDDGHVLIT